MFDPRMVTMSAEQARMIGNERSTRKTRWHTNKTIRRLNRAIVQALKKMIRAAYTSLIVEHGSTSDLKWFKSTSHPRGMKSNAAIRGGLTNILK
jgi:hypothetical protein